MPEQESPEPRMASARVECVTPILRVRDLQVSLEHYVNVLGFGVDWEVPHMASVSRDGCGIMLCQGAQGQPGTWLWIGVSDADLVHTELRAKGATVRLAPTNYEWSYEMHVEDPDGHVLRFGSEPKSDRPLSDWVAWYEHR